MTTKALSSATIYRYVNACKFVSVVILFVIPLMSQPLNLCGVFSTTVPLNAVKYFTVAYVSTIDLQTA